MSGMIWGADSLEQCDNGGHNGCGRTNQTLAWYTKYCYYYSPPPPDNILFWGRYFSNVCWPNNLWRLGEGATLVNNAINWVVPISQPGQSRIATGNSCWGHCDALTFCWNLWNAIFASGSHMHIPSSEKLLLYLDIEGGTALNHSYWQGWATYVNQFAGNGGFGLPFYASAYMGSTGTNSQEQANCSFLSGQTSWNTCYAVWSNQPNPSNSFPGCTGCGSPGPSWGPNNCSGITTELWQYGDQGVCRTHCRGFGGAPVDLDSSNPNETGSPNNDARDYMVHLS